MFIKRNRSRQAGKEYASVLLVQGKRVPVPRATKGRLRKGEKRKTKVVHETLANLSKLPAPLVALVEKYCQAERSGASLDRFVCEEEPSVGPGYGQLGVCLALARELGIERALGSSRQGKLALFLVLARVIHGGSRLSSVRWAREHAVDALLGLGSFDEDDLYAALDWLEENQERIENALCPKVKRNAVFLYDVTSTYFEGEKNELASYGYNRDGKRYTKTVVAGLLTDESGEPWSVQLYRGNTNDTKTVEDQLVKLKERFGASEAVFVGDRGMVKSEGKARLKELGFRYVSSLTKGPIRTLLGEGALQLRLFDESLCEVPGPDGKRWVLRLNPATRKRSRARRKDQLKQVQSKVDARNKFVDKSARASEEVSLRKANGWLKTYRLDGHVTATLEGRSVVLELDAVRLAEREELDGCYVVESDVPVASASTQALWARYGDLQKVARDFRTLKTSQSDGLQLRPVYHRKASRTRGVALVAMLGLKVVRALRARVSPLGLTVVDALERLSGVRLVTLAEPSLGLWRVPTRWPERVAELLEVLPRLPTPVLSLGNAAL